MPLKPNTTFRSRVMISDIEELMIELGHIVHLLEDKETQEAIDELECQEHTITEIIKQLREKL